MKNQTEKKERKWLTKKDAMRYLSVSQRTMENWVNRGLLRSYQISGRIFFDQYELDEDVTRSRSG